MNLLALIPAPYRFALEVAVIALALLAASSSGWMVRGWKDGKEIATLHTQHLQAIAEAQGKTLAAQAKADADHQALADHLSTDSAARLEALTRSERAIDTLRPAVAAGTRVVRVAATCPAAARDVPQAAGSGRMDPAAGAILAPADGQTVLDLRAGITRIQGKLAACQGAALTLTGQQAPK